MYEILPTQKALFKYTYHCGKIDGIVDASQVHLEIYGWSGYNLKLIPILESVFEMYAFAFHVYFQFHRNRMGAVINGHCRREVIMISYSGAHQV